MGTTLVGTERKQGLDLRLFDSVCWLALEKVPSKEEGTWFWLLY